MAFSIGGGLSGSKSSTSSSSSGISKTVGSSDTSLSGESTTTRFDEAAKNLLDALSGRAFDKYAEGRDGYTREQAIADSQGIIGDIFKQFSEQALPEIYQAQRGSGSYNTTSGQLLANDAFGEAVSRSAQVVSDNIIKYAQLGQQEQQLQISTLLDALKLQGTAYESTDVDQESASDFESTTTTYSKSRSSSSGFGGKLGGSFGF